MVNMINITPQWRKDYSNTNVFNKKYIDPLKKIYIYNLFRDGAHIKHPSHINKPYKSNLHIIHLSHLL